jgi:ABC-type branched-subunit amino acid transport system substrate-binding protein
MRRSIFAWLLLAATLAGAGPAAAEDIVLGQVGPFTNIPVPDAAEINQGIKSFVAQANKAGGVGGRRIRFFELDDGYSADGFVAAFGKAMEQKPLALLTPVGSASLTRMLADQLLEREDVVVINAVPGAESLRTPGHARFFHLRAGDRQQIEKIVSHARTLGMTRLTLLYQDFPMGQSGLDVAQRAAQHAQGLTLQSVKSGTDAAQLAAAAAAVRQQQPQGVLVVGAPRFSADGAAALRKAGVSQSIFVLSYVPAQLLVKLAGLEGARGIGIAQTFPNPNGNTLPLQREFRAAMAASFPQLKTYSPFQLEGYLSARVVAEALKRSKERELSPAMLARALQSAGDIDFGGFRVNFASGNAGSRWVDIGVVGQDGRLMY